MLEGLSRDLIIGAAGSVLGALLLSLFTYGWRFIRQNGDARREIIEFEADIFCRSTEFKKQMISQDYLFSALKFFIIAISIGFACTPIVFILSHSDVWLSLKIMSIAYGSVAAMLILSFSRLYRFSRIKREAAFLALESEKQPN